MDANVIIDGLPFNTAIENPSREKIALPLDKKFHIFFSYRDVPRDKRWVKDVINKLETEYGYTCCDHERDFLPGTKIMDNIKDGLKNSEKVVIVFSKEAIDSQYVSLEATLAYHLSLERRKNLVIPVLLDDCDVPAEFMLLTYIDAREGVEEKTWLPKLLKSIKSTGKTSWSLFGMEEKSIAATFAVSQLCSIDTIYSCRQCSTHATSKYVPEELRSNNVKVPVDLIKATYKDLLQSPRVVCRQKCSCLATSGFKFLKRGCLVLFFGLVILMIFCILSPPVGDKASCISFTSILFVLLFAIAICVTCGIKQFYLKIPDSVHNNIIEYNKKLSKYGVMATVVHCCMWKKASEYVIRHLVKEENTGTTEHRDIQDSDQMMASTNDLPLLSGVGEPHRSREVSFSYQQNMQNVTAIDPLNPEEAEHVLDVAAREPLLSVEETENLDYETKALNLLMSCTPEYFAFTYANQLKNPKEDRHGMYVTCLCQYLEQTNENFRGTVKKIQSLRPKINSEENDQDENNTHLKSISLY